MGGSGGVIKGGIRGYKTRDLGGLRVDRQGWRGGDYLGAAYVRTKGLREGHRKRRRRLGEHNGTWGGEGVSAIDAGVDGAQLLAEGGLAWCKLVGILYLHSLHTGFVLFLRRKTVQYRISVARILSQSCTIRMGRSVVVEGTSSGMGMGSDVRRVTINMGSGVNAIGKGNGIGAEPK
jgi:hypothetical protein